MRRRGKTAESQSGEYAVELDALVRRFGRGVRAVEALAGVSMRVAAGEFVAVMGATGSGKSTLLLCAAGLDRPSAGSVRLAGRDLGGLREAALTRWRRDHVGFVFQSYNLLSSLTVVQNVLLPSRLGAGGGDRAAVRALLDRVGLRELAGRRVGELSGGEQQRVAVARAWSTRPAVIFADEPTGALDPGTGATVLRLLRSAASEDGVAVVMVTHDPLAASWADRVVILDRGRVVDTLSSTDAAAIGSRLAWVGGTGEVAEAEL